MKFKIKIDKYYIAVTLFSLMAVVALIVGAIAVAKLWAYIVFPIFIIIILLLVLLPLLGHVTLDDEYVNLRYVWYHKKIHYGDIKEVTKEFGLINKTSNGFTSSKEYLVIKYKKNELIALSVKDEEKFISTINLHKKEYKKK